MATPRIFKTNIFSLRKPVLPPSQSTYLRNHLITPASGFSSFRESFPPLSSPGWACAFPTPRPLSQCLYHFSVMTSLLPELLLYTTDSQQGHSCLISVSSTPSGVAGTQKAPNECLMKERDKVNSYERSVIFLV